jgi:hypothetical protein
VSVSRIPPTGGSGIGWASPTGLGRRWPCGFGTRLRRYALLGAHVRQRWQSKAATGGPLAGCRFRAELLSIRPETRYAPARKRLAYPAPGTNRAAVPAGRSPRPPRAFRRDLAEVDLAGADVGLAEPQGHFPDVVRGPQHDHRAPMPKLTKCRTARRGLSQHHRHGGFSSRQFLHSSDEGLMQGDRPSQCRSRRLREFSRRVIQRESYPPGWLDLTRERGRADKRDWPLSGDR